MRCLVSPAWRARSSDRYARVAWTGAGIRFKEERPSPQALRKAVHQVLADDRYRLAAAKLSERMAQAPGRDGLARVIDDVAAAAANRTTVG